MKSTLKKSLYLGLATLGMFTASATFLNANAASKATKVTSTKNIKGTNVTVTGTNAIYSKPGTVKGAKMIATTTTLNKIKSSKDGANNFYAYRMAKTNKGAVYYKVVSFDKTYRGYVYAGKTANKFSAGLTKYTTYKTTSVSASDKAAKFKLANYKTAATYKDAPAWTKYGAKRNMSNYSSAKNDELKITKQATRTRQKDTWVYVTDAKNSKVNGWIAKSALTKVKTPTPEKPVVKQANFSIMHQSHITNGRYFELGDAKTVSDDMNGFQALAKLAIKTDDYMFSIAKGDADTEISAQDITAKLKTVGLDQIRYNGKIYNLHLEKAGTYKDNSGYILTYELAK